VNVQSTCIYLGSAENGGPENAGLDFEGPYRRSNGVVPVRLYELTRLREMFIVTFNAFALFFST